MTEPLDTYPYLRRLVRDAHRPLSLSNTVPAPEQLDAESNLSVDTSITQAQETVSTEKGGNALPKTVQVANKGTPSPRVSNTFSTQVSTDTKKLELANKAGRPAKVSENRNEQISPVIPTPKEAQIPNKTPRQNTVQRKPKSHTLIKDMNLAAKTADQKTDIAESKTSKKTRNNPVQSKAKSAQITSVRKAKTIEPVRGTKIPPLYAPSNDRPMPDNKLRASTSSVQVEPASIQQARVLNERIQAATTKTHKPHERAKVIQRSQTLQTATSKSSPRRPSSGRGNSSTPKLHIGQVNLIIKSERAEAEPKTIAPTIARKAKSQNIATSTASRQYRKRF